MKKTLFALAAILMAVCSASAREVSGTVHSGSKKLSGVIVTDGASFTKTDKKGSFKLEVADDARFVYIVTPNGYTADFSSGAPQFYRKADSKKFDFDLKKTAGGKEYTLFSVSDPQIKTDEQFAEFCGKPLEDLTAQSREYSKKGQTVGIALGDIVWDRYDLFEPYKEQIRKTGIPFYAVIGNHDYNKDRKGWDCAGNFEDAFGPTYYAFGIGNDYVIVLNNIMYRGNKKYTEGYGPEVQAFLKGLLTQIPYGTHLFIAQHSPLYEWWHGGKDIVGAADVLAMLEGYTVDFLSGHTHIMNNLHYSAAIAERNAPSICGSWWSADWCNDGTPRGFEIFSVGAAGVKRHFHPTDYPEDFQMELIKPGESPAHPNSVLVNIWDYDTDWSAEWFQDGVAMGQMEAVEDFSPTYIRKINEWFDATGKSNEYYKYPRKNVHYLHAEPNLYAKEVKVVVTDPEGKTTEFDVDLGKCLDVQAHRGGAGLMPENTWYSFKNAIDMGVNTLEMDLQISADKQVVVSHDSYFHPRYATRPDGTEVKSSDPKEYIYKMPYDSVRRYDVGSRASTVWPGKAQIPCCKPLLEDIIDMVEGYTAQKGLSPMRYNIEVKSSAKKGEGENWCEYKKHVDLCLGVLLRKNLGDRLVIQCFDVRAMEYMHEKYPQVKLSFLTDKAEKTWEEIAGKLSFVPAYISPNYKVVTKEMVDKCHENGCKIVPWTCDDPDEMREVISTGIDALITNYPDRLLKVTRGYDSIHIWTKS